MREKNELLSGTIQQGRQQLYLELAPMEGVTTYVFRNAYAKCYGEIDKYYTPFLSLFPNKEFDTKELREIAPEHNEGLYLVPQVLTNSGRDFRKAAKTLKSMGYDEVNVNLGCPSGTVTAKHKGAGMLKDKEQLRIFLEEIFADSPVAISIKTRIGVETEEEWEELLEVYSQYPLKELIVHTRVKEDYYKKPARPEMFTSAHKQFGNRACYNGDINNVRDYEQVCRIAGEPVTNVMVGRGLVMRPWMAGEIKGFREEKRSLDTREELERVKEFHDMIYAEYKVIQSGETNVLYRMKELWGYLINGFLEHEKEGKQIRKCKTLSEYEGIVGRIWQ